jgi:hypothetical protein
MEPHPTLKIVQKWFEEKLPDFIPKVEWPTSSPDLNPLEISIWGYILAQPKNYKNLTLDELNDVILKIWAVIPD